MSVLTWKFWLVLWIFIFSPQRGLCQINITQGHYNSVLLYFAIGLTLNFKGYCNFIAVQFISQLSALSFVVSQMLNDGMLQLGELDLTSEDFLLDEVDSKCNSIKSINKHAWKCSETNIP